MALAALYQHQENLIASIYRLDSSHMSQGGSGMIKVQETATFSDVCPAQYRVASSSLGQLDVLPRELLHTTLELLDFQSLTRLMTVSVRLKTEVEALLPYQTLVRHAPTALAALGKTHLIRYHSSAALYVAIRSDRCISCGRFGAYLHLVTCRRCCFECLWRNPSLWVTTLADARKCFALTLQQVRRLPIMSSLPGEYEVVNYTSRTRRYRLVSVGEVKKLSIAVHGSIKALEALKALDRRKPEFYFYKYLREAPLEPLNRDPCTMPIEEHAQKDPFCGVASIAFPTVSKDHLESGVWCRGCTLLHFSCYSGGLDDEVVASIPSNCNRGTVLAARARQARTVTEFEEHIANCHGAKQLDAEKEQHLLKLRNSFVRAQQDLPGGLDSSQVGSVDRVKPLGDGK